MRLHTVSETWRGAGRACLVGSILVACAVGASVSAQEEAGDDDGRPLHKMFFGLETWLAQPAGLGYSATAVRDAGNSLLTTTQEPSFGTEDKLLYEFGYRLPNRFGTVTLSYYAHDVLTDDQDYRPGEYVFETRLLHPQFAGVSDTGLADGFDSSTSTSFRDLGLRFSRPAFATPRVSGEWFVGWRRLQHRRFLSATYRSLLSPLPPLLPADEARLTPQPEFGDTSSQYEGRGIHAGFDVDFNLWRDRLVLETSAGMTMLRGDLASSYGSRTNVYFCNNPPSLQLQTQSVNEGLLSAFCFDGQILGSGVDSVADFSILNDQVYISPTATDRFARYVSQAFLPVGLQTTGRSQSSMAIDLDMTFRFRATHYLDLRLGFRQTRLTDVGLDARPEGSVGFGGLSSTGVSTTSHDATYEGFHVGLVFSAF